MSMNKLAEFVAACRDKVDTTLHAWLPVESVVAPTLNKAMQYSLFNGGKRIRPILTYAGASAVGNPNTITDAAAAAVECIHAYSLVHDDLPAMDDDDLRRGKPTCHIAFDEATAILAGDALQTLAFEKLAGCSPSDPSLINTLLIELATASGEKGMVAGQMVDLLAEGNSHSISLSELETIHRYKTGALIKCAVLMGALSVGVSDSQLKLLECYAEAIGLAFQVRDDIIDVTSDTVTLGKPQGADIALGKSTYVSLLGLEKAKQKTQNLLEVALEVLEPLGGRAESLRWIAQFIVERDM